jgi:hypothetical protein
MLVRMRKNTIEPTVGGKIGRFSLNVVWHRVPKLRSTPILVDETWQYYGVTRMLEWRYFLDELSIYFDFYHHEAANRLQIVRAKHLGLGLILPSLRWLL